MQIIFAQRAWHQYVDWQQNDPDTSAKVAALIEECLRHAFTGSGKPEPLKNDLKGWWSRRITKEHRLVYRVSGKPPDQALEIAQVKFHY